MKQELKQYTCWTTSLWLWFCTDREQNRVGHDSIQIGMTDSAKLIISVAAEEAAKVSMCQ